MSTLSLPLEIACVGVQSEAERRSPAASLRFVSFVSICAQRVLAGLDGHLLARGARARRRSIDISCVMIDSVSIPEAMPPIWMPAI